MGCTPSKSQSAEPTMAAKPGGLPEEGNAAACVANDPQTVIASQNWDVNKGQAKFVMGKYQMGMSKQDLMGEGASSICRKGVHIETGKAVAIKIYKAAKGGEDSRLQKFTRQIEVLKALQEPFVVPADETLWHPQLQVAKPAKLFMELIDYSQDARGNPCADASDGIMYVITELAQYSLKDYLSLRRDQRKNISLDAVKNISKAIIMVVAGLHAKGFVHLDLKPENLMMFNGRLKLIDVDGCVRADSDVSIQDSSISFSPCYCAPEWARFLTEESESKIVARPHLDVWSIGMTLCELAILDPILKPTYANFLRNGHSHREAGFLFMDWLGSIKKAPLPKHIEGHDPEFFRMVTENLLVCDFKIRKTLCQCMDDVYFQNDGSSALGKPSAKGETEPSKLGRGGSSHLPEEVVERKVRNRLEDLSSNAPVHQGTLWKLNNNGKIEDATHWLKRDMWVACNGSLCYFSIKENRRLVLVDASRLVAAKIEACEQSAYEFSFQISATSDEHESDINLVFAAESAEEFQKWTSSLTSVANMDAVMQTMRLGGEMAAELKTFRLTVKNRRMKVIDDEKDQFAAIFKAKLWKVKAEGDRTKEGDWFEREMWISKNGSLVYWSKKEDRDLIYYTSDDMARARFTLIPKEASFKPWAFQVQLPPNGDVEFAPGEFAAETEAMRECWLEEFNKLQTLT